MKRKRGKKDWKRISLADYKKCRTGFFDLSGDFFGEKRGFSVFGFRSAPGGADEAACKAFFQSPKSSSCSAKKSLYTLTPSRSVQDGATVTGTVSRSYIFAYRRESRNGEWVEIMNWQQ